MSLITLSAPSKTFLVGEYIALSGGPTLILNTEPRFELSVNMTDADVHCKQQGIRINSPAGKLIKLLQPQFNGYQLSFKDPHKGAGGFGASSAQFAMTLMLEQLKQKNSDLNIATVLNLYHQCSWQGEGPSPSGADVIAQIHGGLTFYSANTQQLEKMSWPFDEIDFCLIHTGEKIATHQHLSSLATEATHKQALFDIALQTYQSLKQIHTSDFIQCIQNYGAALDQLNLVAPHTQQLIQQIKQHPAVLATKGCGALGADVILIVFDKNQANSLLDWLKQYALKVVVSTHKKMSQGVACEGLESINLKF